MKKVNLLLIILLLFVAIGFAQVPVGFNYQAVIRNSEGQVKANTEVSIGIAILTGSTDGVVLYSEVHSVTTNKFGLVNLVIGKGETTGDLGQIDWSSNLFFIQVSVDGAVMGTSQLLCVPFAMHAATAGNTFSGDYNDLSNKPDMSGFLTEEADGSVTNELQALTISHDTIFLSNGGFVKLPASSGFSGSFTDLTDIPAGLSDGDDDTHLSELDVDAFVANNGYLTAEVDGSVTNEIQALSISHDTIFLSNGGFVKLPASSGFSGSFTDLTDIPAGLSDGDDDTQLSEAEVDAMVANNGYLTAEVDGSATNELQALTISHDTIFLSNGGFVKLPASSGFSGSFADLDNIPAGLADGDDNTQLSESEVDAMVANNGYITSETDGSATNEIQDLSLNGNILTITNNGTATQIDLSKYLDNTDTQLTEAQVDAMANNNGYLTSEVDGSITNEIQDLSLSNDVLKITNNASATSINLASYKEVYPQTGQSGKFLTTDGSSTSWTTITPGATQLSGLSDVSSSTKTSGNLLVANGTSFQSVSISGDASLASNGTLTVADNSVDGTDIALGSDTQGDIMYYNGTDWVRLSAGTSGQVLQTNGAGANPSWVTPSSGSSTTITTVTSNTTLAAIDQLVIVTGVYVVNLPSSPTNGQNISICTSTANGAASINGNGKSIDFFQSSYTSFTFNDAQANAFNLFYSSALNMWIATY